MEGELEEIRDVLNFYDSRFDRSHAKIYLCLLSGEVKTGKQVVEETGLCKQTTYNYLNQLIKADLVKKTKSVPAHFFIENPLKELNYFLTQYLKKQTKLIEEKKAAIKEIINHKNSEFNEHWEIKAKENYITIIDRKENKSLSDKFEARQVKETIEKFIKSLPEENKYLLAYARKR